MFTKIIPTKYVGIIAQYFKWQTIVFKFLKIKSIYNIIPLWLSLGKVSHLKLVR